MKQLVAKILRKSSPRLLLSLLTCATAAYADQDAQKVITTRGGVDLIVQDIDTLLAKAPENQRSGIVANPSRLDQLIESELISKQIAAKGRELGLTEDEVVKRRLARAINQELAAITLEAVIKNAGGQNFDTLAKESYLANDTDFVIPEESSVQHILVSSEKRTPAETRARASEVLAKAQASGANFEALVNEYSDDPSKATNKGVMDVSQPGQFVLSFENAAKALKKVGDISPLVETEYGTHVLMLKARTSARKRSFEEARPALVEALESEFKEKTKSKFLSDLRAANPVINADIVELVRNRYGAQPDYNNLEETLKAQNPAPAGTN